MDRQDGLRDGPARRSAARRSNFLNFYIYIIIMHMAYYFSVSEAMYNCGSIGFRFGDYAITLRGELRHKYKDNKPAAMAEIFNEAPANLECEVKILAQPLLALRINGLVEFDGHWDFNLLNCQISCESFCIPNGFRQYDFIATKTYIVANRKIMADIVNTGMPIHNAAVIETDSISDDALALFPNIYGIVTRNTAPSATLNGASMSRLLFMQIKHQGIIYINTLHPFYTASKLTSSNNGWIKEFGTTNDHGISLHMNEPLIKNAYN
jgi:hypothetical protein